MQNRKREPNATYAFSVQIFFPCKQPQDDVEYRIPLRVQDTALVSCYSDEMKSEQVKIKDLSNADSLNIGSYSFETTLENMGKLTTAVITSPPSKSYKEPTTRY